LAVAVAQRAVVARPLLAAVNRLAVTVPTVVSYSRPYISQKLAQGQGSGKWIRVGNSIGQKFRTNAFSARKFDLS